MTILSPGGTATLLVPAGQSVTIGNPGGGVAKLSTAAFINSQRPPVYSLASVIAAGAGLYTTFAVATNVLVEAPVSNPIEYNVGVQPALVIFPFASTTGLTARAGGGQALATPLTGSVNKITVCATIADSVILPTAVTGARIVVFNGGATSCNVFPQTGESINSGAANAAFAVATTKAAVFDCVAIGVWNATLSA